MSSVLLLLHGAVTLLDNYLQVVTATSSTLKGGKKNHVRCHLGVLGDKAWAVKSCLNNLLTPLIKPHREAEQGDQFALSLSPLLVVLVVSAVKSFLLCLDMRVPFSWQPYIPSSLADKRKTEGSGPFQSWREGAEQNREF